MGDVVLAIGNPFGVGQTVTMGIVSATDRGNMGIEDYEDFIQTDAAINPGNSGGALVDIEGRLIGINTAICSRSGGNQGIGFAIPSDLARNVMDSLIKYGHVTRGYLGVMIQDVTPTLAKEFKLKEPTGALVGDVVPKGPADKAGFKDGDVVLEFNGKKVADSRHLKLTVAETKPGTRVPVKILRDGESQDPRGHGRATARQRRTRQGNDTPNGKDTGTLNGVGVSDLDQQAREQFKVPDDVKGAVVTEVQPDSAAAEAGLKPGDIIQEINRHPVKNAEEAVQLDGKPEEQSHPPAHLEQRWQPLRGRGREQDRLIRASAPTDQSKVGQASPLPELLFAPALALAGQPPPPGGSLLRAWWWRAGTVLVACWSLVYPLYIPYLSLIHPLYFSFFDSALTAKRRGYSAPFSRPHSSFLQLHISRQMPPGFGLRRPSGAAEGAATRWREAPDRIAPNVPELLPSCQPYKWSLR